MSSSHILTDGETPSQRASISSDHSEIPSYPQSDAHASPDNDPVALPSNDAQPTQKPLAHVDPESTTSYNGDYPTIRANGRRLIPRPDTASTTASFASARAEPQARASIASASSSRRTSPKKPAPSRIGRDFEALLASDETYILKETSKVARDPEEDLAARNGLTAAPSLLVPSSSSKRVIVERRRERSSSSLTSNDLEDVVEEFTDVTPRPPDAKVFQSPSQQQQAQTLSSKSTSTGTPLRSAPSGFRGNADQVPASPDRTTSLQRRPAASPSTSSPSSTRKAEPMSSAMPPFMLPVGNDTPHGPVRARPRPSNSLGLEQEIDASAAAEQASSMGSFRQRMKKTSGFLRKLRKDNTQVRRDKYIPRPSGSSSTGHAYSIGSNHSATSLGRSGTSDMTVGAMSLGRRESKASVLSHSGSSVTGSTSHSIHKQSTLFSSTDGVAVPSIPERFMQRSESANSHVSSPPAGVADTVISDADRTLTATDSKALAPPSRSGLRVPSAPATLTEWSPATKMTLPQRSSSQGHEHRKSLIASDSTGAIRLAVQQLESHMNDALKQDERQNIQVEEPRQVTKPKQQWGPSPQLPDLDIQRYKERNGSFLEEPGLVSTDDHNNTAADHPHTARSSNFASYPTTPATTDSYPHNVRNRRAATGLGIDAGKSAFTAGASGNFIDLASEKGEDGSGTIKASNKPKPLPLAGSLRRPSPTRDADSPRELSTSARSSQRNSIDPMADAGTSRRTANSGASLTSVRSFETAAESEGLNSADPKVASFGIVGNEQNRLSDTSPKPSPDDMDTNEKFKRADEQDDATRLEDVEEDQEQSIRLVTKRSNTEDLNAQSEPLGIGSTTIVTAPASPNMDSSALPKMVELSEQSFLRPGRNGSISRGFSASSGSVRGGSAALLSTPSVRRSPSPVSSPTSARTSYDTPLRPTNDEMAPPPAVAASAQELATKCWEEDPSFLKREKIAEWLGGLGLVNRAARAYYFANFDLSGLRLDNAFRKLCDKLFLRAETQQTDRILAAFSQRYYECNPDSVFGSSDVIHSVVFSILLLNTDLHIAELQERMTRQQFVKNTLGAIAESGTDVDDGRSSFSVAHNEAGKSTDTFPQIVNAAQRRNSISSYLGGGRGKHGSSTTNLDSSTDIQPHQDSSRPGTAVSGNRNRDVEIENMLKDIYAAVKSERILLPAPEAGQGTVGPAGRSSGSFGPMAGGVGGRRKVGGKGSDRMTALKRGSIRGIQGLLGGLNANPSLLDPAVSPNTARSSVDSWGRMSSQATDRDRMLSPLPTITPGFASTLTQTIIKESMEEDASTSSSLANGLSHSASSKTKTETMIDEDDDDDTLALAGPPWAKEGSLTRKHYWESTGKRAKDKSWIEVFVVVSKGTLSMFRFDSIGTKNRTAATTTSGVGGGMGGGDWLSNATCLGEISLAHSLANASPPPGYNKTRPYVFALTLPGGKVYFFQTGHEELVNEWVSTCNYWAARQSKEPLAGGVSNMEYGWNKVLPQPKDDFEDEDGFEELDGGEGVKSPIRSVYTSPSTSSQNLPSSVTGGSISTSSNIGFITNEKTFINEWRIPQLPTLPSTLSEERQLIRLEKQVKSIQNDLILHNELRQPMLQLYSPKGSNYSKALANWEKKSNHLLQELVKYQSYTEALKRSGDLKAERRAKREVEVMLMEGDEALAELKI